MFKKTSSWYKLVVILLILILVVPVLAACGDDDDEGEVTTQSPVATTAQPTSTTAPSPTPTSVEPIKVGIVGAWSGPAAIVGLMYDQITKVLDAYLEETGGLLGGRSVEFVKCDGKSEVASSIACYVKLTQGDDISIMIGGSTPAVYGALADPSNDTQVPYVTLSSSVPLHLTDYPYVVRAAYDTPLAHELEADFIINQLKPKTIAILTLNDNLMRAEVDDLLQRLEPLGADIVSKQYVNQGTTDMSPYLTQIKHDSPDLLITILGDQAMASNINKTIPTLGGWGDITVLHGGGEAATADPLNEGDYGYAPFVSGETDAGSLEFERLIKKAGAKMPAGFLWYQYSSGMVALKLIEGAGTDDPIEIAKYARSGEFSWDKMPGMAEAFRIGTDGENNLSGVIFHVEGGKAIPISGQ